MAETENIQRLQELARVDIDAAGAYDQALDAVADPVMRSRLAEFRQTHFDHIAALADVIRSLGGTPPELSMDLKGRAVAAAAALRAAPGTKGALKALRTAEEIARHHYAEIVSAPMPQTVKDLLRRHFSDTKIHLDYIAQNLKVL